MAKDKAMADPAKGFPRPLTADEPMSRRDRIAMQVVGYLAQRWATDDERQIDKGCRLAYLWADAMLRASEKTAGGRVSAEVGDKEAA